MNICSFLFLRIKVGDEKVLYRSLSNCASLVYTQGQVKSNSNLREYFYFIDHHGMLFLDDSKMKNFTSCFKEKKFLEFFYKHLQKNNSGEYENIFPYISPCGREMNYIRCDDTPIVYTGIINNKENDGDLLTYGYVGPSLSVTFQPEELCMLPESGRVYHPAESKYDGIGLIKSSLSIEISKYFKFSNGETSPPTEFIWKNKSYRLTNSLYNRINN